MIERISAICNEYLAKHLCPSLFIYNDCLCDRFVPFPAFATISLSYVPPLSIPRMLSVEPLRRVAPLVSDFPLESNSGTIDS